MSESTPAHALVHICVATAALGSISDGIVARQLPAASWFVITLPEMR